MKEQEKWLVTAFVGHGEEGNNKEMNKMVLRLEPNVLNINLSDLTIKDLLDIIDVYRGRWPNEYNPLQRKIRDTKYPNKF